jgi:DNA (cytosine-5)-methyltransferase 1
MRAPLPGMSAYPATLASAWAEAMAPRAENAPTVVSLFAGGGGSSLGYAMAGFRERLAVDWDGYAAATLRANFPAVPVYEGDITSLSIEEVLGITRLTPGELDVLDGSPPCQGFSTGGRRVLSDPRNDLFTEYVRLLKGLRPKVLVLENVAGLVKGKMRLVFADIMRALKASGYIVATRLMNTCYFGVPQSRARLIFLGVRADLGILPSHPKAQSWPISVQEALEGVAQEPVPTLSPKYRDLAPMVKPGQCAADIDRGTGFQNLVRLRWDRPAPTINRLNPGTGLGTPLHPVAHRSLSIPEAKRLCSFPDEFVLPEDCFPQRWGVLGNAVPPLFMRAIALHITEAILDRSATG